MTFFKLNSYSATYLYLILLRIILVLIPQVGYIHPDEFFQSVEVLAGKVLDVECSPPWEFNSTFAIRSMTIPYFTIGVSYKFIKEMNILTEQYFNRTLLTPYLLLVTPRILMCILSFIVDYSLYKICSNNNEKYKSRLIILSSSYIMLVYGTHTFSNTFELILFSILLYFVCESLTFSNILTKKREYINYRYEQSKSVVDRAKFHKLRLFIISDSYRNCFFISTITVFGFFNRPTFLAFAIMPVFFWLYRGIGSKSVTVLQFNMRILVFALCSIPTFLTIILIDSFYYGYITWGEVGVLDVSINNFVFTPLNFLKYNMNSENLALHGLHPRFLHVLVNVPLLFNVLGIIALLSLLRYAYMCFQRKYNLLPSVRSIKCLMTLSFVTPILLLSMFPHQEPRFLIPVVIPLAYLHGMVVLPEADRTLVEAPKLHSKEELLKNAQPSYFLLKLWLVINTLLTIFYGFLHQGGVYQATTYISKDLAVTPITTEYHIVTSHMYSLPESFLLQKPSNRVYKKGKSQYTISRRVFLYEEGSKDIDYILKKLHSIVNINKAKSINAKFRKFKIYLIISNSLTGRLNYLRSKQFLNFYLVETFYPHVSMEAFPDLSQYCMDITRTFYTNNCTILPFENYFYRIFTSFGLSLYEISLNDM